MCVEDLDYMHARYYSPGIGRFLSVDTFPTAFSAPQGWNRYAYVLGNPLLYNDPAGLFPVVAFLILGDLPIAEFKDQICVSASGGFCGVNFVPISVASLFFGGHNLRNLGSLNDFPDEFRLTRTELLLSSLDDRSFQAIGEIVVGFGDTISLGLTEFVRSQQGLSGTIDEDSGYYLVGQVGGAAHGIALGGTGLARAAGWQTKVALHGAHHNFGKVGQLAHIQLNWWKTGVKGSGSAIRLPLPWR